MDRNQLLTYTAMVLTTVNEDPSGTIPKSPVYLVLNHDMEAFDAVTSALVLARLITMSSDLIKITEDGRKVARELEVILKKAPPPPPNPPQGWASVQA